MVFDPIVEIVFRFINFFVIIGIFAFIIKKYFLPLLYSLQLAEIQVVKDLQKSVQLLSRNYRFAQNESEKEQQVQAALKEKVMRWRAQVEEEQQQLMDDRSERYDALVAKLKKQLKNVKEQMILNRVLPQALEEARAQLEEKYAIEQSQQQYIEHTLDSLHKKHK